MAFSLPYSPATSYIQQILDANSQVMIWRKDLAHESTNLMQFAPFMGKGPLNCIQHFDDLEAKQGTAIMKSLMKRIAAADNRPYQGDVDTHGKEVAISDTTEQVVLKEWRLPSMSGRAEKQKPNWNYDTETEQAIRNYVAEMKDLHIYEQAIGIDSNDGDASALFSGEIPTNVVYPEGVTSLDQMQPSHTLNVEQGSRAAEIAETGYSDSNTQVWVSNPPTVGGEKVRGVLFHHPYSKYDLRWDDQQRFESWLTAARERGEGNPIWKGIPDKFLLDGILYVTLRHPLAKQMLRSASTWGVTPGCQVAFNVYMTSQAILRATAIEDILEFENWDGKQFLRVIGGSYEGIVKCRFDRGTTTGATTPSWPDWSTQASGKDFGVVIVPCASYHHND